MIYACVVPSALFYNIPSYYSTCRNQPLSSSKRQPCLKRFKINFIHPVAGFSQLTDVLPYCSEHRFRGWWSHDRTNQPFEFRRCECQCFVLVQLPKNHVQFLCSANFIVNALTQGIDVFLRHGLVDGDGGHRGCYCVGHGYTRCGGRGVVFLFVGWCCCNGHHLC